MSKKEEKIHYKNYHLNEDERKSGETEEGGADFPRWKEALRLLVEHLPHDPEVGDLGCLGSRKAVANEDMVRIEPISFQRSNSNKYPLALRIFESSFGIGKWK